MRKSLLCSSVQRSCWFEGLSFVHMLARTLPSALVLGTWALAVPAASAQVLSKSTLTINEGHAGSYTVALEAEPAGDVTVSVNHSGDRDISAHPTSLRFTPTNWHKPQEVTVKATRDADSTDDQATLTHSMRTVSKSRQAQFAKNTPLSIGVAPPVVSLASVGTTNTSPTVGVVANDVPSANLNLIPGSGLSIFKGSSSTFTASLAGDGPPTEWVTISVSSNQSSNGVTVSPSSATVAMNNWTSSKTFRVSVSSSASVLSASISVSTSSNDPTFHGLSDSMPITVLSPEPTISCSPASQTIEAGDNATLTWNSSNATSVTINPNPGISGTIPLDGSHTFSPSSSGTYRFRATRSNLYTTDSCSVTVTDPITISQPPSSVSVDVGETKTYYTASLSDSPGGQPVTITTGSYSDYTIGVTSSGRLTSSNWLGGVKFDVTGQAVGSTTISHSASTKNSSVDTTIESTFVTVKTDPTITCSADDLDVKLNGSTTVRWSTTHAQTVTLNKTLVTPVDSGYQGVTPESPAAGVMSENTNYDFEAIGALETTLATCSVTVTKWRPPVINDFDADPPTIDEDSTSKLRWQTTYANSASINQQIGSVALDNTTGLGVSPDETTDYTLTASNDGYTGNDADTDTVRVTVNSPPGPTITCTPASQTIEAGDNATLTWNSSNADSVTIDPNLPGLSGTIPVDGSHTFSPSSSNTYTFTAAADDTNEEGTASCSVTVNPPPAHPPPAPTITCTPASQTIEAGDNATLTWNSSNADSVTIDPNLPGISGTIPVDGSHTFLPSSSNTYTFTAAADDTNEEGTASCSVTVTEPPPDPTITCTPASQTIEAGDNATLTWNSSNADSVTIDPNLPGLSGTIPVDGSHTFSPSSSNTYTFTAAADDTNEEGTASCSVTVTEPPPDPTITCTPASQTIEAGDNATLTWNSSNADSVTINPNLPGLSGTIPVDGSHTFSPSSSNTYTFTAAADDTNEEGTASCSVTVNPPPAPSITCTPASQTIEAGDNATLTWNSSNADSVTINPNLPGLSGTIPVDGSHTFSPSSSNTYTFTAAADDTNEEGTASCSVTVTEPPPDPTITCTPASQTIEAGDNATLTWNSSNADSVTINPNLPGLSGTIPVDGSHTFSPSSSNTYTFTAAADDTNEEGTASCSVTVTEPPPAPTIDSFYALPSTTCGGPTTLTWTTSNTTDNGVKLDGVVVADDGSKAVSPSSTTDYELTAEGEGPTAKREITVTVGTAPTIHFFKSTPSIIYIGNKSVLRWQTTGATSASITPGYRNVSVDGTRAVYPDVTRTYVLMASNSDCFSTRQTTVTVTTVPLIILSSNLTSVAEPDGTAIITATVPEGDEPSQDTTVNLSRSGTATENTDYTLGSITINNGETSGETNLLVVDNYLAEGTQTVQLTGSVTGYQTSAPLTINLNDNDIAGVTVTSTSLTMAEGADETYEVASTSLTMAEGADETYEVALTSQPFADVTITIGGNAEGDEDVTTDETSLTFIPSEWTTPQTVTVSSAHDDDARNDTVTFTHTAGSFDPAYDWIEVDDVDVHVTDDETVGITILPTSLTIAEGSQQTYEVALTSQPFADVTITIDRNAEGDEDVTTDETSLTFIPSEWATPQTVTVSSAHDGDARNDTVTFTHTAGSSDPDYNGIEVDDVDVHVTDDETVGITILPTSLTIAEGSQQTYEVALTSQPFADVTITIGRNAEGDEDVTTDETSLTFIPSEWTTPQTVTVSSAHDGDARNDTATFTHTAGSSDPDYDGIEVDDVDVRVTDDEKRSRSRFTRKPPGVLVSESNLTVPEGESRSYSLVLTSQTYNLVYIAVGRTGDEDMTADPESVTFTVTDWNQSQTVTVLAAHDDDARNDTVTFTHIAGSFDPHYDGIEVDDVDVHVTDDETVGITILPTSLTIAEGSQQTYEVALTSQPFADVTITIGRNAEGDEDVTTDETPLTFIPSEWTTPQTVTVSSAHDDDARNDTVTFTHIAGSSDPDYNGIEVDDVDVHVTDDETVGITILPTSLTIAEGSQQTYEVALTSQPFADVTITIGRNAEGDEDVTTDETSLTFIPSEWATPQTVTVSSAHDGDARNDTVTFTHIAGSSDPDYDGIEVDDVDVHVTDDETVGITILPTSLTIAEGSQQTYEVALTSQPFADVTITIGRNAEGDEDVTTDETSLTFIPSEWATPQTVTVSSAHDDDARNDTVTFTHTAGSFDPDYDGIEVDDVDVHVTDDETVGITILPTSLTIAEGSQQTYEVALTSQPFADVTITIGRNAEGDEDVTTDETPLTFIPSEWATPQTVTVSSAHDDDARNDTVTFTHTAGSSDPDYDGIEVDDVDVHVTDDETVGITILPTSLTIAEGSQQTYEVALTSQPFADVTITIGRNAEGDEDVTTDETSLTFIPSEWTTPQTVTVSSAHDDDARNDTVTFTHIAGSSDPHYDGIEVDDVDVHVTDDETVGITILPTSLTIAEGSQQTYEVALTSQPFADVTITIGRNAEGDEDVTTDETSLTFIPSEWTTPQTVTVSSAHDDDARNDTVTFTHTAGSSDPAYDGIEVDDVDVEILDDGKTGVSLSELDLEIPEGESRTYELLLSSRPLEDVSIRITLTRPEEEDPEEGDVATRPPVVRISPADWQEPHTVTVFTAQDEDALDETALIEHEVTSSDAGYHRIAVSQVNVTVLDDDEPAVIVSPVRLLVGEGKAEIYEVVLATKPAAEVSLAIAHDGDEDVTADQEELVFTRERWNRPQSVEVSAAEDPDGVDDEAVFNHTVTSDDEGYDQWPADSVEVEVEDNDPVGVLIEPLELTLNEEDTETYRVVLASRPAEEVTVRMTRRGDEDVSVEPKELVFEPEAWNKVQSVTVAAAADEDATNDTASVDHAVTSDDPTYDRFPAETVTVEVIDDDEAGIVVSPTTLTVTEGSEQPYTVVLRSRPSAPVTLTLDPSGDEAMGMGVGQVNIVPEKWNEPHEVVVSAGQDDDAVDDSGRVDHAVASQDEVYAQLAAESVEVEMPDDDEPGVTITPNPEIEVEEGSSGYYTVELDTEPMAAVAVVVKSDNLDVDPSPVTLDFDPSNWNKPQKVVVHVAEDEDSEDEVARMRHTATSRDPQYDPIDIRALTVQVTDMTTDDVVHSLRVMLGALAGAHAESVQTALEGRFERRRQMERTRPAQKLPKALKKVSRETQSLQTHNKWQTPPNMLQSLAMVARGSAPATLAVAPRRHSSQEQPSARSDRSQQDFEATLGSPNSNGGLIPVLWGHGDLQRFSGRGPDLSYGGGLSIAHVGVDLYSSSKALAGISLARSWGGADYRNKTTGSLTASLYTLHPYLYLRPHERVSLWGIAGVGGVGINLIDPRDFYHGHGRFQMLAGGARAIVAARGATEFGVRVDGFRATIAIDPTEKIEAVSGTANRSRVMFEAVHHVAFGQKTVSLKSETGGRCDSGDAGNGCGVEIGLRLGVSDPTSGLAFALHGRSMATGIGGYRDWGMGAQVSWDPGLKQNGLHVALGSSLGQDGQGRTSMWNRSTAHTGPFGLGKVAGFDRGQRTDGEVAYGLDVLSGRGLLTPYSRLQLGGRGRDLRLGTAFSLSGRADASRPFMFNVEGLRRKRPSERGDLGVALRVSIPF